MSTTALNLSSSRDATPIRAITSQIANRSTPTLPSSDQSYEPLIKSLFRGRLRYMLLLSVSSTWCVINCWTWWQSGGVLRAGLWAPIVLLFGPLTMFITAVNWALVALPVIVLHKVFLTERRSSASSPIAIVKISLSLTSTKIAYATHLVSAISALITHLFMVYTYEMTVHGDPKLSVFVKSRKHPHYLNGRLLFLILSQVTIATAFLLRGAFIDRYAYRWTLAINAERNSRVLIILVAIVVSSIFTTIAISLASVLFALARILLPALYRLPLLPFALRPLTGHFLRGPWTLSLPLLHLGLLFRAWFLGFATFISWEIAECLFEKIVAETTPLSTLSPDHNTTLVSGVASSDRIFKFFAYVELRDLSRNQTSTAEARRIALFGDQKHSPNLWTFLARESLLLLGHDYQLFLRRGQPLPPTVDPVAPKAVFQPTSLVATPTPLLRQKIFRSTQESPVQAALNALGADGPIAKAVEAGAEATQVPELFRSVEARVFSSPVAMEAKKSIDSTKTIGSRLKGELTSFTTTYARQCTPELLKEGCRQMIDWWERERMSKVVQASLPFRELDIVVIEALSHLVCASLTEDRYGIVQRDIPKILEVLTSFLSATEEYQLEITSLIASSSPSKQLSQKEQQAQNLIAIEVEKAQEILGGMADGLRGGIARIVRTFGDKLLAFKLPSRVAQKLQGFLDYC